MKPPIHCPAAGVDSAPPQLRLPAATDAPVAPSMMLASDQPPPSALHAAAAAAHVRLPLSAA